MGWLSGRFINGRRRRTLAEGHIGPGSCACRLLEGRFAAALREVLQATQLISTTASSTFGTLCRTNTRQHLTTLLAAKVANVRRQLAVRPVERILLKAECLDPQPQVDLGITDVICVIFGRGGQI